MDQIIYSKRFPLKEWVPKMQKDENKEINSGEWERLKQVAIDFSEGYDFPNNRKTFGSHFQL